MTIAIRAALNASAAGLCAQVRSDGDEPCYQCRAVAREVVLAFLSEVGDLTLISPLELRLRIIVDGSDA